MSNTIETIGLSFSYGRNHVLNCLSMHVPKGSIFGLLGCNGAGKSTTLKLLLGLLPSKKGKITFFGESNYGPEIFYRIGNLIESPSYYEYMTVEEHLKMLNIIYKMPELRINEVLAITSLTNEKNKKATNLSTGLKQRLGIAIALFHDPELLILDEPMNGLDPLAIIDIRNLLLKLQQEGKTILFSSHIISEMEKLCTHIGIISEGKMIHEGAVDNIENRDIEGFYISILRSEKH